MRFNELVNEFLSDDTGPTAVEYAGIIAITGVALKAMADAITTLLNNAKKGVESFKS